MEYVYTFVGGSPDFVWLSKRDFRRRFGLPEAAGYLQQIRGTLVSEAKVRRCPGCFYTGLRHAFAELDGLGKLYKGAYGTHNTARNAVEFGVDYLGRVNSRYKDIFGIVFDMYRHGHLIRTARYLKGIQWRRVYWIITEARENHLPLRTSGKITSIAVSVAQLIDDTIAAIDGFIGDLNRPGVQRAAQRQPLRTPVPTCLRQPSQFPSDRETAASVPPPFRSQTPVGGGAARRPSRAGPRATVP